MTKEELKSRLDFWQPIMLLADWNVSAQFVRHLDRSAWCKIDAKYKRAWIRVLDPIDWPADAEPMDLDRILTHELGHLHFWQFATENDSPEGIAEEQAVEAYSRALVSLYRR